MKAPCQNDEMDPNCAHLYGKKLKIKIVGGGIWGGGLANY